MTATRFVGFVMSAVPSDFFPNKLLNSDYQDVVALGGELRTDYLLEAYSRGIFPWPHEGYPLLWFFPEKRGVITQENFCIPRSLRKFIKKQNWRLTWNQSFEEVIESCQSQQRPGQDGTWISHELKSAYIEFHKQGYAKSLEVWEGDHLIGGIYGVLAAGNFSAESMFYKKSNASQYALWMLCEFLFYLGLRMIDIQMVTAVTEKFGGRLVPAREFLRNFNEQKQKYLNLSANQLPNLDREFTSWMKLKE